MENYDLSTINRNQLHQLLSTAKYELMKYLNCKEDTDRCKRRIAEDKEIINGKNNAGVAGLTPEAARTKSISGIISSAILIFFIILMFLGITKSYSAEGGQIPFSTYFILFLFLLIPILLGTWMIYISKQGVARRKTILSNIRKNEEQLPYLEKKQMSALEEFCEIKKIPSVYRYPLAIDTMLGFVDRYTVSTWKECANSYDTQCHRWTLEKNSAENLQLQREILNLTGDIAKSAKAAAIFSGLNFFLK